MHQPNLVVVLVAGLLVGSGCSEVRVDDPMETIIDVDAGPSYRRAAMEILDAAPEDPAYLANLRQLIYRPGFIESDREAALDRLAVHDDEKLQETIAVHLPSMDMLGWRERLCQIIAERGWVDQSDTLVRAWARPMPYWADTEEERPERLALVELHGETNVIDYVFQTFLEADPIRKQGLRERCWELLDRLGQRERLRTLLAEAEVQPRDSLLIDLRAAARDLGLIPHNREEILWLRKLRQPEHASFWVEASEAVQGLSSTRRVELEVRDLPVVVAARRHAPELLSADNDTLYRRLVAERKTRGRVYAADFTGWGEQRRQTLPEYRDELTWGDLAAMHLLLQAMDVPQVVAHLYDYAERDRKDRSTEYGGIIRLDREGRYEIVEFASRRRVNDKQFNASQEMFDAGYTGLFHFHFHVQEYKNRKYASPHVGDISYADSTRANCAVFTFVERDLMNVDFYRHGSVIVDLGEVPRP